MGFLDKLLKAVLSPSSDNNTQKAPAQNEPAMQNQSIKFKNFVDTNPNANIQYFASLLNEDNFPGYSIEQNVMLSRFDSNAHPKCFPITFLFKKDGMPVLAVIIMRANQRTTMPAVGTYTILDEQNIPYLRFYLGWENEKNYVLNRIKENL